MQSVKRFLKIFGVLVLLLVSTMLGIALINPPKNLNTVSASIALKKKDLAAIESSALEHLAEASTFRIVGYDDANNDSINHSSILAFHAWLKSTYPLVGKQASWEIINQHSLLITLKGSSKQSAAMFIGHMDVVPTPDSNQWKHAPYKGNIVQDTLWARARWMTKMWLLD